jgi:hypothetical protein
MRTFRDIKLAYRSGAQKRTMPVYAGASGLVAATREVAEVYITTTRPYMRLDNIDPDTRAWLDRHNITYDALLYDEEKCRRLARIVDSERVVAVLDDLAEHYDRAADLFGADVPLLRRTRWNRDIDRPNMVYNLLDARDLIVKRARDWNECRAST